MPLVSVRRSQMVRPPQHLPGRGRHDVRRDLSAVQHFKTLSGPDLFFDLCPVGLQVLDGDRFHVLNVNFESHFLSIFGQLAASIGPVDRGAIIRPGGSCGNASEASPQGPARAPLAGSSCFFAVSAVRTASTTRESVIIHW